MKQSPSTLSELMNVRARTNAAQRAAMTGADRRREERDDAAVTMRSRRYLADMAHRAGDHVWARRLLATPSTVSRQARPRGAGRPGGKRTASSSTTSSQDPGESEPPPAVAEAARRILDRAARRLLAAQQATP